MEDRERVTGGQLKWRIFRLDTLVSMPATVLSAQTTLGAQRANQRAK